MKLLDLFGKTGGKQTIDEIAAAVGIDSDSVRLPLRYKSSLSVIWATVPPPSMVKGSAGDAATSKASAATSCSVSICAG